MSSTMMRSKVIALTTDSALLTKLRNKLVEYDGRLGIQARKPDPRAIYKYRLLKALLDDGVLDVEEQRTLFAQDDWHQPAAFEEVVRIIESYNEGETAALRGGTGLR